MFCCLQGAGTFRARYVFDQKFFRHRRAIPNRSTSKQPAASNNLECVGKGSAPLLHTWFVSGHATPTPDRDKCQGTDLSVPYQSLSPCHLERPRGSALRPGVPSTRGFSRAGVGLRGSRKFSRSVGVRRGPQPARFSCAGVGIRRRNPERSRRNSKNPDNSSPTMPLQGILRRHRADPTRAKNAASRKIAALPTVIR